MGGLNPLNLPLWVRQCVRVCVNGQSTVQRRYLQQRWSAVHIDRQHLFNQRQNRLREKLHEIKIK